MKKYKTKRMVVMGQRYFREDGQGGNCNRDEGQELIVGRSELKVKWKICSSVK